MHVQDNEQISPTTTASDRQLTKAAVHMTDQVIVMTIYLRVSNIQWPKLRSACVPASMMALHEFSLARTSATL